MLTAVCDICGASLDLMSSANCPIFETDTFKGGASNLLRLEIQALPDDDPRAGEEKHICEDCKYLLRVHIRAVASRIVLHRKGLYTLTRPSEDDEA